MANQSPRVSKSIQYACARLGLVVSTIDLPSRSFFDDDVYLVICFSLLEPVIQDISLDLLDRARAARYQYLITERWSDFDGDLRPILEYKGILPILRRGFELYDAEKNSPDPAYAAAIAKVRRLVTS